MRKGNTYFVLSLILFIGIGLMVLFTIERIQPPLDVTFSPAFQFLGRTTKTFDRVLSRTVPVSDLDEKRYGEAIALQYNKKEKNGNEDNLYLNDLIKHISCFAKKPFDYRVFVCHSPEPNAFALPGGAIFITDGLLTTLESEAEIISILAHEMGHVEYSHCFDAVRFELAARNIGKKSLGKLADFTIGLMLWHSFSKTQEDEADAFAYKLILNTIYDPVAPANAFKRLMAFERLYAENRYDKQGSFLRDYFSSHPPLVLRYEKYCGMAKQWWSTNKKERRYCGKENLSRRISFDKKEFENEWVDRNKRLGNMK